MYYFIDDAGSVYAFVCETDAPEGLSPISESDALALAGGPSSKPDYPALIAAERYKREGAGVPVNDFLIDTSRDSQALLAGAAVSAIMDPSYRCNWKTSNGFVELTSIELLSISTAVRNHVQACFDRELALLRVVEAGEYSDHMLLEGWPEVTSGLVTSPGHKPYPQ
ncbi:DUF4376 domain-containing protein [Pseudomonas sp. MYb118]|uniref:DUF4376 domain-containing protein n=1 Tax=Pseudomonas sp. MYb118 TaxID=1848720 RepID=UPI0034CEF9C0